MELDVRISCKRVAPASIVEAGVFPTSSSPATNVFAQDWQPTRCFRQSSSCFAPLFAKSYDRAGDQGRARKSNHLQTLLIHKIWFNRFGRVETALSWAKFCERIQVSSFPRIPSEL
eukprot:scaffold1666_cov62-Cylindrotheca_fusiformis.AAC.2